MIDSTAGTNKRLGTITLGALTAGALAAAAMVSVPTANATCASFFGIGSGGQCTSTFTSIAIAIGENAEAHADGILGAALTLGNSSSASTVVGALANLAISLGNNNFTSAGGIGSLAFAGRSTVNQVVVAGMGGLNSGNVGNLAISIASPEPTQTSATGIATTSVNLAGSGLIASNGVGLTTVNLVGLNAKLENEGLLNAIANVSGDGISISNKLGDGGIGNLGFNFIGENNVVQTRGTLALAGAIGSIGQTVTQDGLGANISFGRRSAGAAATRVSAPAPSATTAVAATDDTKSTRKARGAQSRANRGNR